MKILASGRRLASMAGVAVVALALAVAAPAFAGVDHWYSGNLYSSYGYASSAAHSISYVQGNTSSSDLICVGIERGTVGSYYDPTFSFCQANGYGAVSVYYNPSCCWHGAIDNGGPLNPTYINYATHYDY